MKNKEDLRDLANGELWETFKKTLYFEELERFCIEKTKELRESIIQASVDRDYEKSRDLAQQLSAETLQLYYQITLLGRRDIGLAPDEFAGFT
jgi:DNA polymerase III gamma/tau subunit